jgi:hypothetical protein
MKMSSAHFADVHLGSDAFDLGVPRALPGRWHQPLLQKGIAIVKQPPPVPHGVGARADRGETDFSHTL